MLKICDASICKPLELIFLSYLENRKFLTKWKKSNLVLAHTKKDEQNYRPILCLQHQVAGKIFGKILYNGRLSLKRRLTLLKN